MIKRYRLEWDPNVGVSAWADKALLDEHAQDSSIPWRVRIGRRLHLARTDIDGSTYLRDWLESDDEDCDVLEMVRESQDVWLTTTVFKISRMKNVIHFDEYELDDGVTEASAATDEDDSEGELQEDAEVAQQLIPKLETGDYQTGSFRRGKRNTPPFELSRWAHRSRRAAPLSSSLKPRNF